MAEPDILDSSGRPSFAQFVHTHLARVFRYAWACTGDSSQAAGIAFDQMVRAALTWRRIPPNEPRIARAAAVRQSVPVADTESAARRRLWTDDHPPPAPADLAGRILTEISRRRRYRRLTAVGAVALALTIPMWSSEAPPTPGTARSSLQPDAPLAQSGLGRIAYLPATTIPAHLPGGGHLRVLGMGRDGWLVGASVHYDPGWVEHVDAGAWWAHPSHSPRPELAEVTLDRPWTLAVGAKIVASAEGALIGCGTRAAPDDHGGGQRFFFDRDVLIRQAEGGIAINAGCAGRDFLELGGRAEAFAHPSVFVHDGSRIQSVDVDSREITGDWPIPLPGKNPLFAANQDLLVQAAEGRLAILELATGKSTVIARDLPRAPGMVAELTLGNRVVVYSARRRSGDPDAARSFVYDLPSGTAVYLRSEAYAAGNWLLWREGADYRVAVVRPQVPRS